MSTKIISKILIVALCVTLAVSLCSCTGNAMKQVNNIKNFATDAVSVVQSITDESISVEEKLENAEADLEKSERDAEKLSEKIETLKARLRKDGKGGFRFPW